MSWLIVDYMYLMHVLKTAFQLVGIYVEALKATEEKVAELKSKKKQLAYVMYDDDDGGKVEGDDISSSME